MADVESRLKAVEDKVRSTNKDTKCLGAPLTCILTILFILYVISPIDLIPDFIPIIGWIDDLLAILAIVGVNSGYLFGLLRRK
jgi:uncharacterized membrane protein YkvA (DUF1232 family)